MPNAEINPVRNAEIPEPAREHEVLTGFEFLQDFRSEAKKAEKRVWAQAMAIQVGTPQDEFFKTIQDAQEKGLDTRIRIDWFSHLASKDGIHSIEVVRSLLGLSKRHGPNRLANESMYQALYHSGVDIKFVNKPTVPEVVFPFMGRSHIKMYLVDDIAYIGGVNMEDSSFKGIDFVVKYKDPEIVEALAHQFEHGNEVQRDYRRDFSDGDQLIVDAGDKGKSAILDRALEMVGNATSSVRAISFFTPDGRYAKALSEASKRGIDVEVIRPEAEWGINPFSALDLKNRTQMKIGRMQIPFIDSPQRIHAKLLIVDETEAIFGSHNFMESGVRAGTEEIAMCTQNPEVVEGLKRFYSKVKSGEFTQPS